MSCQVGTIIKKVPKLTNQPKPQLDFQILWLLLCNTVTVELDVFSCTYLIMYVLRNKIWTNFGNCPNMFASRY